jgi:hypothetical protein
MKRLLIGLAAGVVGLTLSQTALFADHGQAGNHGAQPSRAPAHPTVRPGPSGNSTNSPGRTQRPSGTSTVSQSSGKPTNNASSRPNASTASATINRPNGQQSQAHKNHDPHPGKRPGGTLVVPVLAGASVVPTGGTILYGSEPGNGFGISTSFDGGLVPLGSDPGASDISFSTTASPLAPVQTRRILRVKNDTGGRLRVFVQYHTLNDQNQWAWYPVDPGQAPKGVSCIFDPGEETTIEHSSFVINADRVRIWAVAEQGEQWTDYQDADLWLVPEVEDGKHQYRADQMEAHTFTFSR